jgi:transcription antitermination factor NusG
LPDGQLADSFVIRTQQRREMWAAENVARLGRTYYLPTVLETKRVTSHGVRRKEYQVKPLFPAYLFVQADEGQWHELLRAFGVAGVIPGANGQPAIIKAAALARIRALEQNGVVVLPKEILPGFQPNQSVRVMRGAYSGFTGLVQGMASKQRAMVLIDYMGGKVKFMVREDDLELAA